jgi:hypothetical protein
VNIEGIRSGAKLDFAQKHPGRGTPSGHLVITVSPCLSPRHGAGASPPARNHRAATDSAAICLTD